MTPRLVAISDRAMADSRTTLERFAEIGRLARPSSVLFQLRDLELSARDRFEFGRAILAVARETQQLFAVNDRVDLAVLLGADGIHLGESGVATTDARRLLHERSFVSRACHDPEFVAALDADLLLLAPVFEPRKGREALGADGLVRARERLAEAGRRARLFALGGVTAARVAACLAAGADGVAVVGAIFRGEGPALVRELDIER